MAAGDVFSVPPTPDLHYVDTGMYDTTEYGSVYLLDAERPAVVDTGTGATVDRILDGLREVGIAPTDLEVIALTHVHLDHAGGAGHLLAECPNATVVAYERGAGHLRDPDRLVAGTKAVVGDNWEFYADPEPIPDDRLREVAAGGTIDLGDRELRVHPAHGHAPHQAVFEEPSSGTVFTADAAGIYVPATDEVRPTSPPSDFDLERVLGDVHGIHTLDPEVLCYGHFGAARADDRLREYANVIASWVAAVAAKRAELDDDEAVAEHFGETVPMIASWGERRSRVEGVLNARGVMRYLDELAAAREE
jgi:glyoxylase-like metal-dependent hydrolase (beta-lactamase superfamily II)